MEERLSALFESRVGKVEQEMRRESERMKRESERMRGEMEKQRGESERMRVELETKMREELETKIREEMETNMEKQRVEMEKQIDSLRSNMTQLRDDNTQLKIDYARLTSDLTEIHDDLRILHPLPYARLDLQKCITHQIACNEAVNAFIDLHTLKVISVNPSLSLQLQELKQELKKSWDARFAAAFLCEPRPTLANVLWIVAKSGFTKEVAPLMNLSKATRECKDLQREMREVMNEGEETQLFYFCEHGMTSSVVRMLEMRSIDVEARQGGRVNGQTCLMTAANNNHLAICRLLIDKGAQMEAKNSFGRTPLHCASYQGHDDIARLLCDHGADVEARINGGWRPVHLAAMYGHISVVKELIEERNAEINARDDSGRTALGWARARHMPDVAAYLVSRGGIE